MRRVQIRRNQAREEYHRRVINPWTGTLSGCPAFIIGNGCSVLRHDFSLLADYFTIGINRAFKLLDPTIVLWQDISLWREEYDSLRGLKALKVARDIADPQKQCYIFHLKPGLYKFTKQTYILYGSGSSGPLGCELAVGMGCSALVLLGMDCKLGPNGESDFYGDNPHWYSKTLENCRRGLLAIQNQCPVPVISCSDNELWNSTSLENAIEMVDPEHKYALGREQYINRILRR